MKTIQECSCHCLIFHGCFFHDAIQIHLSLNKMIAHAIRFNVCIAIELDACFPSSVWKKNRSIFHIERNMIQMIYKQASKQAASEQQKKMFQAKPIHMHILNRCVYKFDSKRFELSLKA